MFDKDKEMDKDETREIYLRWCMETGSLMSESGYEAFIDWWRLTSEMDDVGDTGIPDFNEWWRLQA